MIAIALGFVVTAIAIPGHVDAAYPALAIFLMTLGLLGLSSIRIARLERTIKKLESNSEKRAA